MPMPVTCCDRPSGTVSSAMQQPEGGAGQRRHQHADPQIAARIDGEPAGEGAGRHDALDAEIEHAGALADQLAEGGEDQRRGDADAPRPRSSAVSRMSSASIAHLQPQPVAGEHARRRPWSAATVATITSAM